MPLFPSPQWVAARVELSNSDKEFRAAGAGWNGAVGGVIEADPTAGVGDTEPIPTWLDPVNLQLTNAGWACPTGTGAGNAVAGGTHR